MDDGGVTLKTTLVPVCGPHVVGEMRNVCSIRMVAGDGGFEHGGRIRAVNRPHCG